MIKLLPLFDGSLDSFRNRINAAKTSTYTPDCAKTIFSIDFMDLNLLMEYNQKFFDACMDLLKSEVEQYILSLNLCDISSLDDLLNCGFFGEDYESSRSEFISAFLENL